ncbi:MAG: hypothetical protein L6416_06070 [Candidatus Omnitrophica bacterium]|nr:hypothetical protein [Candidatus Omnitrophota bacterium]
MSKCKYLAGCIFFNENMSNMPRKTEELKSKYCLENNSQCARYIVCEALGRENVPINLFPMQKEEAENIIKYNGNN